jgi:hypothetical protein
MHRPMQCIDWCILQVGGTNFNSYIVIKIDTLNSIFDVKWTPTLDLYDWV